MSEQVVGNEKIAAIDYATYLQLPQLLALQRPLMRPAVHDEMLFVIVHQAHELWFKQVIWELRAAISQIDSRRWPEACRTLQRLSAIVALLVQHVAVLETMPPSEFERFRGALGSASGVQSTQFREIELLSGCLSSGERSAPIPGAAPLPGSANLRQAFLRACSEDAPVSGRQLRTPLEGGAGEQRRSEVVADQALLRRLYSESGCAARRRLADGLLELDEQLAQWRASHVRLVRGMIANKLGTGGSSGVQYLQKTLQQRLLPELGAARQAAQGEARVDPGARLG